MPPCESKLVSQWRRNYSLEPRLSVPDFVSQLFSSKVARQNLERKGTVAAVAALAATLFRQYINIHNLLS